MINNALNNSDWKQDVRKWIYVFVWGVVSFFSSFTGLLHGDISFIKASDISETVFAPVLFWSIAFFADYIYEIGKLQEGKDKLDKRWTVVSYLMIEVIFVSLLVNVFTNSQWWRVVSIIAIFMSMLTLKAASLYVLCPLQSVESVSRINV